MKTALLISTITLTSISACCQHLDMFEWLAGTWREKKGKALEIWITTPQGFSGKAYNIARGDTTLSETIVLTYEQGHYYYIPDVAGDQAPVRFRMTEFGPEGFLAENPDHDFPKKIRYRYQPLPRPMIEASVEGDGKVITYSFLRID